MIFTRSIATLNCKLKHLYTICEMNRLAITVTDELSLYISPTCVTMGVV